VSDLPFPDIAPKENDDLIMTDLISRPYLGEPCYPPRRGRVADGWDPLITALPPRVSVIAVDGPVVAAWPEVISGFASALAARGIGVKCQETSTWTRPWPHIQELTSSPGLRDDPDFDKLAGGDLADLFDLPERLDAAADGILVVFGPGAALLPHDVLCYADLPKRYAEAAVRDGSGLNLGQPSGSGPGTTKRLFYVDWPLLDRHRDRIAGRIDWWIDMQTPDAPALLDGPALRATLADLASRPFRVRPTFNTTPWGGKWAQQRLGQNVGARNTALGYELIAPESGILIGDADGPRVEIPFQLAVSLHPAQVLGDAVHDAFGTSFPVRFDYLDTVGGGNLSVHCHPRSEYMREVFGWPYPQHETYYLMVGDEGNQVFLGLRGDADPQAFHQEAHDADTRGKPFPITRYVQTFAATPHQLFLIPAGTPHGSGEGNVVLEISATPYLYSLRFYDWLRRDPDGGQRPVHVTHAFRNLDIDRRGEAVPRELIPGPRPLRDGPGWREELIGALPEMFFEVRRVVLEPGTAAGDDTAGRFHILNVVEGDGAVLEAAGAPPHPLAYAETLLVPAAVGPYVIRTRGPNRVRIVKALVR
jgi:mannose-6-phosphate isomerase class I